MITQENSTYNIQLRRDFNAQRDSGIRIYSHWLEQRLEDVTRENTMLGMGAAENFRLWQEEKAKNERLLAGIDEFRDWLRDNGYSMPAWVLGEKVE